MKLNFLFALLLVVAEGLADEVFPPDEDHQLRGVSDRFLDQDLGLTKDVRVCAKRCLNRCSKLVPQRSNRTRWTPPPIRRFKNCKNWYVKTQCRNLKDSNKKYAAKSKCMRDLSKVLACDGDRLCPDTYCVSNGTCCLNETICTDGSCVADSTSTCCPDEIMCGNHTGICIKRTDNITCAHVNVTLAFLEWMRTFNSSSQALAMIDPNLLNAFVDILRSRVSEEVRARITPDDVVNLWFPNPNATFDFGGLDDIKDNVTNVTGMSRALALYHPSRALAFWDQYPPGCAEAFVAFSVNCIFIFFAAFGIRSKGAAEATTAFLKASAAAEPMIVNLFNVVKRAWLAGYKTQAATYVFKYVSSVASALGLKILINEWWSHLTTAEAVVGMLDLTLSVVAMLLTDGVSLIAKILFLAEDLAKVMLSGVEWYDKCWPDETCGAEPDCDDKNKCTSDKAICGKGVWKCQHTPVFCPPGMSCSLADGHCKVNDEIIPCVSVIDEDESFGSPNQDTLWAQFRTTFPARPFCLLVPGPEGQVTIPKNFANDSYTTVRYNVSRDNGDPLKASNWTEFCGLDKYTPGTVPWAGLFVDDSGSLTKEEVIASYNKFVSDLHAKGIEVQEVVNENENWILPFLTTLVPGSNCTADGKAGQCLSTGFCAAQSKKSVPYKAGDPEPSCRKLPYDIQCCVPFSCIAEGQNGTCLNVDVCAHLGKKSVPWKLGDPEPNCRTLPTDVQCCIPNVI